MTLFRNVAGNSPLNDQIVLSINNFRKGATAPTDDTLGTSPTIGTLRFANTNELLSASVIMPVNWDRTVDAGLLLFWALAAGQTNGDTLDITVDYTVALTNTGGAGVAKTSTFEEGQITVVTGELAIGDPYTMAIGFARADAENPYTSDDALGFFIEIHMTNTDEVASVHFLGACVDYERLH